MSSGSFWLHFSFNFILVNEAFTLIKYISPILYYIAIILCLKWLIGDFIRDLKFKNRLKLIKILDEVTNVVDIPNEIFYDVVKEELKIKEKLKREELQEKIEKTKSDLNMNLSLIEYFKTEENLNNLDRRVITDILGDIDDCKEELKIKEKLKREELQEKIEKTKSDLNMNLSLIEYFKTKENLNNLDSRVITDILGDIDDCKEKLEVLVRDANIIKEEE